MSASDTLILLIISSSFSLFYEYTCSYNHRVVWAGTDVKAHPVLTPCYGQRHLTHVTQDSVQGRGYCLGCLRTNRGVVDELQEPFKCKIRIKALVCKWEQPLKPCCDPLRGHICHPGAGPGQIQVRMILDELGFGCT